MVALESARETKSATARAVEDLQTKSSIYFKPDSEPGSVQESEFFMRITPVWAGVTTRVCMEQEQRYNLCYSICWYVPHRAEARGSARKNVLDRYTRIF